jgi:WD40 repeat protein
VMVLEGHAGLVTSLCYSPHGDSLASAGDDGTVRIWDRKSGKTCAILRDSDGPLRCVAYSPDGRRLAAAGDDGMIRIYEARTLQLRTTCAGSYWPLSSIAWSPEADRIAAASSDRVHGSTVVVWQTRPAQKVGACQIGHYEIHDLVFTPNGRHVAIAAEMPALILWSPTDLRFTEATELASSTPHLHLTEESSPHLLRIIQRFAVNSVSFSSNRQWLATADGADVALWEVRSGRLLGRLSRHRESVAAIDSSGVNGLLASAGTEGLVCIWDAVSQRLLAQFEWELGPLTDVAFSPDGQTAAVAGGSTIVVWDVE